MAFLKSILTFSKVSTIFSLQFIAKHYFVFLFILSIIPNLLGAIQIAQETQNPAYPILAVSIAVTNADAIIDKDVRTLKTEPEKLLGQKPEIGLWKNTKYYFGYLMLFWKFAGNIILILTPFLIIHKIYRWKGKDGVESSASQTFTKTIITGFVFIFFINLILIIIGLIDGTFVLTLPDDANVFYKSWLVIKATLPFHGVFSLIFYLASQINPSTS